jgi:RimJ/RimL family protein N-acetyltransferase
MKPILETPRLRLRELTLQDLDFAAEMLGDAEVMRHYPKPLDREESLEWIERQLARYAAHGHGLWLAEERETRRPVGQVGLILQDVEGAREPEIGYLLHRSFWRRGLATEAALGVRRHAFETLRLSRVVSLIRPANLASHGVARRLGMAPEREVAFHGLLHILFSVRADGRKGSEPPAFAARATEVS